MSSTETSAPLPDANRSIGSIAERRRRQLRQFDEHRRREEERLRQARAELAKSVAEAEARERRKARTEQSNNLKRVKFVLGDLVIGTLRMHGVGDFTLTAADFGRVQGKDRQLLDDALTFIMGARTSEPPTPASGAALSVERVDIPL